MNQVQPWANDGNNTSPVRERLPGKSIDRGKIRDERRHNNNSQIIHHHHYHYHHHHHHNHKHNHNHNHDIKNSRTLSEQDFTGIIPIREGLNGQHFCGKYNC